MAHQQHRAAIFGKGFLQQVEGFEIEIVEIAASEAGIDLSSMTVDQLKTFAKDSGLKGYSKLKKSQLVEMLG